MKCEFLESVAHRRHQRLISLVHPSKRWLSCRQLTKSLRQPTMKSLSTFQTESRPPCAARIETIETIETNMNSIEKHDPDVWAAIAGEIQRQRDGLEMIASENYTSPAVMQCMGSVLTNKYAEGYPGRRYYGGCQFVDVAEDLARNRAKQTLRGRACQRPAALRGPGQCGRLLRRPQSGRRRAGPRPGPRRTPDPRHEAQLARASSTSSTATASGRIPTASISTSLPPWPRNTSRS